MTSAGKVAAKIIEDSNIDAVLVGDSAAMVIHGYETTVNANVEMMVFHTAAVRRALQNKLLISDVPFLTHKKGRNFLVQVADRLMKSGAQAIKIEGSIDNCLDIKFLVNSGIPVMGHLGLTPQSVHQFGGFKLQGNSENKANELIQAAKDLEDATLPQKEDLEKEIRNLISY